MKEYDIVYSIGSNCACAIYLNKNNLRKISGPFDWLTGADFKSRIALILNDFDGFMNIEDFEAVFQDRSVENEYYINKKTNFSFLHDFPKNVALKDCFEEVKQKYDRRIARFYRNINENSKVLLVWFSLDSKINDGELVDASNKLNKKFNKNIDILIIEHDEQLDHKTIKYNELSQNIMKYTLFAKKDDEVEGFTRGNIKKCNQIFKKYYLNYSLSHKFKIALLKPLINFIPIKKLRKKVRNKVLHHE